MNLADPPPASPQGGRLHRTCSLAPPPLVLITPIRLPMPEAARKERYTYRMAVDGFSDAGAEAIPRKASEVGEDVQQLGGECHCLGDLELDAMPSPVARAARKLRLLRILFP